MKRSDYEDLKDEFLNDLLEGGGIFENVNDYPEWMGRLAEMMVRKGWVKK